MPFIDSKITVALEEKQKEAIKAKLGEAVSIIGKTENFLMVGFEDKYDLYLGGNKLERGAFVSVRVYGQIDSAASEKMTGRICDILQEELGISESNVYVTYQGIADWGWNGRNF